MNDSDSSYVWSILPSILKNLIPFVAILIYNISVSGVSINLLWVLFPMIVLCFTESRIVDYNLSTIGIVFRVIIGLLSLVFILAKPFNAAFNIILALSMNLIYIIASIIDFYFELEILEEDSFEIFQ